ncbi:MAG: Mov34/MPN/PAD-1 family protein [Gemmatimonadota bacterium]|nr:Mov34/MPN/PAD-1 family protein [Gemmatimonadota bacterium]
MPDATDPGIRPRLRPLPLPAGVRDRLARHAEAAWPAEACGILVGRADAGRDAPVDDAIPLPNLAGHPDRAWRLDPLAIAARVPPGGRLLGFWHSHPDRSPLPSRRDVALALPGFWQVVIAVSGGRAGARAAWRPVRADAPRQEDSPWPA